MNSAFVNELHKAICKYYVDNYGNSISQLISWKFSYCECVTIPELLAVVHKYDPDTLNETMLPNALDELKSLGYLSEIDVGFFLTESGLRQGTSTRFSKCLNFLNKNPGVAVIISMFSLLVSITALYISSKL